MLSASEMVSQLTQLSQMESLQALSQQGAAQTHWLVLENAGVHQARRLLHNWLEVHLVENVPLQIHAGRDFDQFHAVAGELEHAALGDE